MKKRTKNSPVITGKQPLSPFAKIMIALGAAAFVLIVLFSNTAVNKFAADYHHLLNADMSTGVSGTLFYNDRLYAVQGFGIELLPEDGDIPVLLATFLERSVRSADEMIMAAGLLYTMVISVITAYAVYERSRRVRKLYIRMTAFTVCGVYAAYILVILLLHGLYQAPFIFPEIRGVLCTAVSLLCIVGGNCALAWLWNRFPHRKIIAAAAVPLCFGLFLFSTVFEGRLFAPQYVDSFDYVMGTDSRVNDASFEGPVYYDEERNVLVVGDTEYPPQQIENPDCLSGIPRTGAYLFEILDPWSGSVLYMVERIIDGALPAMTLAVYAVKALCWICFV